MPGSAQARQAKVLCVEGMWKKPKRRACHSVKYRRNAHGMRPWTRVERQHSTAGFRPEAAGAVHFSRLPLGVKGSTGKRQNPRAGGQRAAGRDRRSVPREGAVGRGRESWQVLGKLRGCVAQPSSWRALRLLVLAAAAGLSACTLGPDVVTPSLPPSAGYPIPPQTIVAAAPQGQHYLRSLDIPGQWWTLFHSRVLDDLVATALHNNPDLEAAQATLLRARENALAERSGFLPQLNGGFNGTGGNVGDVAESPLRSGSSAYTLLTPQVSVGYAPDVFGLRQAQVEALDATANVELYQLEAAYLTLTSNVVVAAI